MKFIFSGTMLRFSGYSKEIEVSAGNFQLALEELLNQKPALKEVLLDGPKCIRRTHQIFLNGEKVPIEHYSDEEARRRLMLSSEDSVYLLTAIAGG